MRANARAGLIAALNSLQRPIHKTAVDSLIFSGNRSLIPLSHGFVAHYRTGAASRAAQTAAGAAPAPSGGAGERGHAAVPVVR
jgi:hypothetical protein